MPTAKWIKENQDRFRQYRRDWYHRNKATQIPKAQVRQAVYRARNLKIACEEKDKPCADCGVRYPYYVMDFDHLGEDKTEEIAKMVWRPVSEAKLRAEIAKCEAVCANCHRIRTFTRRAAGEPENSIGV